QRAPHQWSLLQTKSGGAVALQVIVPAAPIDDGPRKFDLAVHDLQRLIETFVVKGRPENRMPIDHGLPRPPKDFRLVIPFDPARELIEVSRRLRRKGRVKENAF